MYSTISLIYRYIAMLIPIYLYKGRYHKQEMYMSIFAFCHSRFFKQHKDNKGRHKKFQNLLKQCFIRVIFYKVQIISRKL